MKDIIVNEAIEMVNKFLNLVPIDLEDKLDRQSATAYIFRMLNGRTQKDSILPEGVQALISQFKKRKTNSIHRNWRKVLSNLNNRRNLKTDNAPYLGRHPFFMV